MPTPVHWFPTIPTAASWSQTTPVTVTWTGETTPGMLDFSNRINSMFIGSLV